MSSSDADPRLDHLVLATPDLPGTLAAFEATTGVAPVPGGPHPGKGTRNHLVALSPSSYLEIIGRDPDQQVEPTIFGIAGLEQARLVTWAVHPDDVEAAARLAAGAGADLGPVAPMSRRTPAGDLLRWRLAAAHPAPWDGLVPFVIDWGETPHPASSGLPSVRLEGLHGSHPEPETVGEVLSAIGVRLVVVKGAAGLHARFVGPEGAFVC